MATHSSILVWEIPWTEKPGRLHSPWGLKRIRHSLATKQQICCCCCQIASVVSDSVRPHRRQPTRPRRPWDSPGKNTGVGCHFLLQRMKVKSESEVSQLCPTLSDPMDCSLPGSSGHGILQARAPEWVASAFSKQQIYIAINKCCYYYKEHVINIYISYIIFIFDPVTACS